MKRRSMLLCLGLVCLPATVRAQQSDTAVIPLGEIVARGARPVTSAGGASALEVNIDSLRTAPAPTLEEVLRRVPLVQVRTNSRGEAQFSLRGSGSDARQVAVLIDGIPVSLGWDHRADLSILPAGAARSVTVARGLPSLLYGPNVLGGVVDIAVAARAQEADVLTARFDAALDHTGARTIAVQANAPIARARSNWLLRAGGAFRERSGFALPADAIDLQAQDGERSNSDYTQSNAFAAARYQKDSGGWLSASMLAFDVARGIPAELHISSPRYWRYPDVARLMTVLGAGTGTRTSPLGGTGEVDLSIGADLGRTRIDQFDSPTYEQISQQESSHDRTMISRLRLEQSYGGTGRIQGAFTYADINHDETLTPGGDATYRQRLWSGAVELSSALPAIEQTRISLGAALDGADTPETGGKPALSALGQWGVRAGITSMIAPGWIVHGGVSWRARFPALRELYSGALGRFEPNPALKPELLRALEAGTSFSTSRAQIHAVAFHHELSDAIVRISQNGRFKRVNRDRQASRGIELLAATQLQQVTVNADLVLQRTVLRDEGTQAPLTAEYQPAIIAGAGVAAPLPFEIRFDGTGRVVGKQQCIKSDTGATMDLPTSRRIDAQLSREWAAHWRSASAMIATVAVDNATNGLQYDQCGLPQPGRTFRFQVSVRY